MPAKNRRATTSVPAMMMRQAAQTLTASPSTISLANMELKARAGTATYIETSMRGARLALVTRPKRYPTSTAKNVGPMMLTIWCMAAGYTGRARPAKGKRRRARSPPRGTRACRACRRHGISALMDEALFYHWLVVAWIALAAVTFVALFFVTLPTGVSPAAAGDRG